MVTHLSHSIGFIMDPDLKPASPDKHKKDVLPLKPEILPSFQEEKLVKHHKIGRIGKLTLVAKDDRGDVTTMKIHWEVEEKPSWLMLGGL